MAVAWIGLAYIMFGSKRYLGGFGMIGMYIHALCGYAMLIITMVEGIKGIRRLGHIVIMPHTLVGFMMVCLAPLATFSGSAIMILGKPFCKIKRWESHKTEKSNKLMKYHKRLGYGMLLVSLFACSSGILVWHKKFNDEKGEYLGLVNLIGTLFIPLIIEIIFRKWRKNSSRELMKSKTKNQMTVSEF